MTPVSNNVTACSCSCVQPSIGGEHKFAELRAESFSVKNEIDPDQYHPVFPRRPRNRLDALKEEHTIEEIPNLPPSEVSLILL